MRSLFGSLVLDICCWTVFQTSLFFGSLWNSLDDFRSVERGSGGGFYGASMKSVWVHILRIGYGYRLLIVDLQTALARFDGSTYLISKNRRLQKQGATRFTLSVFEELAGCELHVAAYNASHNILLCMTS